MSSLIVTRRNAALGVLGAGTAAALAACSSSNSNSNSSGGSSSSSKSEPAKDYKGEVKFDSFDTSAGEYVARDPYRAREERSCSEAAGER